MARRAGEVQVQREQGPVLLVDLGNFVAGKRHGYGFDDPITLQCLDRMAYDVLVIGEGELIRGLDTVDSLLVGYDLKVVSNNILVSDTGELRYEPYRIVKAGRLKIGISGMVVARTGLGRRASESQEVEIADGIARSHEVLKVLRKKKVDVAVLVVRGSMKYARELADSLSGYDVILTGEGRASNLSPEKRGDVIIAPTAGGCAWLGELRLTVERKRIVAFEGRSYELGQDDGPIDEFLRELTYTKLELNEEGERVPRQPQGEQAGS